MAKAEQRLVTEHTDTQKTVDIIERGLFAGVDRGGEDGPLARLTMRETRALAGLVFYALGEVLEQQFYPSDREQCQEVARELHRRAGLPVPVGVVLPGV